MSESENETLWTQRRPKLLVVDDQALNIRILSGLFQDQCEVFMARNGVQALAHCESDPPDLILLDVEMPEMDGFEVCRRLKLDPALAHVPVIFITGHDTPEEETRGLELGAVDFIAKPINPSIVTARVRTHLTLKAQSDILRDLAYVDGLTGVPNRRRFDQCFDLEWRACRRAGRPMGVLIVDVDAFKAYNDHYGHLHGDDVLRQVARILKASLKRPRDFLARYGGEEFACLLPDYDIESAVACADFLRSQVHAAGYPHEYTTHPDKLLTVSIGAASRVPTPEMEPSDLLKMADQALYRAKQAGRNRVMGF